MNTLPRYQIGLQWGIALKRKTLSIEFSIEYTESDDSISCHEIRT